MTDLELAVHAALEAGKLLHSHFGQDAAVDEATHHDIKLALDKQSQDLITGILLGARPDDALYGEEGLAGNQDAARQWIVDPIDGTVNFYYGIPHFCVSIALRVEGEITVGVIHDPMVGETWTAVKGVPPQLNGRAISASPRTELEESILFVGCGKDGDALSIGLERFKKASLRARKMRMMGSAALGMAYIACGRLDGYIESRISLWDIAAGKLIVEGAGGAVDLHPVPGKPDVWSIVATNGRIPIAEIL
ncbi:inositol monophosphatase [Luteolibacter ambystomatis]|uniref:Inositol-1-monophosphatase n=1 Tax=Luteolibacter ambystomatis TaxID=2824561 RepID=A0A975G7W1_9BACT|nr:inositol monophosphatase family protein [Luteolibacter ambystomatis]QUE50974.1 inositol monophosphatase [Luteolibacter ambystomatis]